MAPSDDKVPVDDFSIDQAQFDVMVAARKYENSGNPLYLWKLVKGCADHGQPIPQEAMAYLGKVAERLMLCANPKERDDPENIQKEVFSAVFGGTKSGRGGFLEQFWNDERDFQIGVGMEMLMAETVVTVASAETEEPAVMVQQGASMKQAIRSVRHLAPELSDDASFRRAMKNSNLPVGKKPRG